MRVRLCVCVSIEIVTRRFAHSFISLIENRYIYLFLEPLYPFQHFVYIFFREMIRSSFVPDQPTAHPSMRYIYLFICSNVIWPFASFLYMLSSAVRIDFKRFFLACGVSLFVDGNRNSKQKRRTVPNGYGPIY